MTITCDTHPLDLATQLAPCSDGTLSGHTCPAYANSVRPFGGIIAATLLNAALTHRDRLGDPVSLTVNFAAPIIDGEFRIEAVPVRTNRSTQHWTITLTQSGEVATTATAVFAIRRDTWLATDAKFPQVPHWNTLGNAWPAKEIAFTKRYDVRYIGGCKLGGGSSPQDPSSTTSQWVRDNPSRPLDFLSLAAMCDIFAPRISIRRSRIVLISTVSMTAYFHADSEFLQTQGTDPVLGTARASHFGKGYHDQVAEIWNKDGAILATSHQIVYFKE